MKETPERAIATMMMAVLDWVVEATTHIQKHVPANEGYSLEMLAKMEMARAESHELVELSNELGVLYDIPKRTKKIEERRVKLFKEFFERLERCNEAFDNLSPYFSVGVRKFDDRQAMIVLREMAPDYMGRQIEL